MITIKMLADRIVIKAARDYGNYLSELKTNPNAQPPNNTLRNGLRAYFNEKPPMAVQPKSSGGFLGLFRK